MLMASVPFCSQSSRTFFAFASSSGAPFKSEYVPESSRRANCKKSNLQNHTTHSTRTEAKPAIMYSLWSRNQEARVLMEGADVRMQQ